LRKVAVSEISRWTLVRRSRYETVAPRRHADLVIDAELTSPRSPAATIIEATGIGQRREGV
jgi:hypothetical protein